MRAHLSHVGFPLLGDAMYGGPEAPRTMLHATFLALRAFATDLSCGAPLWPDMAALLTARGLPVPSPDDVDGALTRAARTLLIR